MSSDTSESSGMESMLRGLRSMYGKKKPRDGIENMSADIVFDFVDDDADPISPVKKKRTKARIDQSQMNLSSRSSALKEPSSTPMRNAQRPASYNRFFPSFGGPSRPQKRPLSSILKNRSTQGTDASYQSTNAQLIQAQIGHKQFKKDSIVQMKVLKQKATFLTKLLGEMKHSEQATKAAVAQEVKEAEDKAVQKVMSTFSPEKIQRLKSQISELTTTHAETQKDITMLRNENSKLMAENEELRDALERVNAQNHDSLNQSAMESMAFEETKQAMVDKIASLRAQRDAFRNEKRALIKEVGYTKRKLQLANLARRELKESIREQLKLVRQEMVLAATDA